eukprot:SAG31_NODE_11916_length_986_cov_1.443067_1_plen_85_part_00
MHLQNGRFGSRFRAVVAVLAVQRVQLAPSETLHELFVEHDGRAPPSGQDATLRPVQLHGQRIGSTMRGERRGRRRDHLALVRAL